MTEFVFTDPDEPTSALGVPKFRWPFQMQPLNQGAAVVEQDSVQEVAQCVYAILATEEGTRPELPDFGLEDSAFKLGGLDLELIRDVAEEWEPRADLLTESTWSQLLQEVKVRVGV